MCDLLYNGNASEAASLYNASSFSIAFTSTKKTKQNKKENSKMYKQSTNQHHTENKMQIWKIVEEKSQCESKFQKPKIKNQKIHRESEKKTFGNVLDFTDRRVEKEPFGNLVLLLVAQLCFFNVRHFSLSLSLFWECGRFWKGIEFAVCVLFVCVCCRGEKEDQDLIGTVSLVWWGLCDERNGRTRLFGSHRGKQSNPRGVRSVKCEK